MVLRCDDLIMGAFRQRRPHQNFRRSSLCILAIAASYATLSMALSARQPSATRAISHTMKSSSRHEQYHEQPRLTPAKPHKLSHSITSLRASVQIPSDSPSCSFSSSNASKSSSLPLSLQSPGQPSHVLSMDELSPIIKFKKGKFIIKDLFGKCHHVNSGTSYKGKKYIAHLLYCVSCKL